MFRENIFKFHTYSSDLTRANDHFRSYKINEEENADKGCGKQEMIQKDNKNKSCIKQK
jgi:hypothetical protein